MTVSYLHAVWTVLLLAVFAGITFWAFRSKNRKRFEEAGRIPLDADDDRPVPAAPAHSSDSRDPHSTVGRQYAERTDV